ncbi:hypothetical protein EGW08_014724 [Elysia chlorotica]|uniref:CCDC113/CCDC96 coiled-coil domain-containing protein n=1 Tax=Elysia chlorotica TaxID=188477 RepID=A0A433T7E1_ELYCH|nr:hypothetical protein EGW08_014724 [Elysia chlorotica]
MADAEENASAPAEAQPEEEKSAEEAPEQSAADDGAAPESDAQVSSEVKAEEEQAAAAAEDAEENTEAPAPEDQPSGSAEAEPAVEAANSVEQVEGEVVQDEAAKPEEGAEAQEGADAEGADPEGADAQEGADVQEGAEQSEDQTKDQEESNAEAESSASHEDANAEKPEGEDSGPKDEADGEQEKTGDGEGEAVREEGEEVPAGEEVPDQDEDTVAVGERLSRGATPPQELAVEDQDRPEATTPDKLDEVEQLVEEGFVEVVPEEDEQEVLGEEIEEEEPAFRRQELLERYHEALAERDQLQQQNYGLQHKLAEHFKKKKADERQDYDKNITDQEQRYLKYMAQLEELRRQDGMEKQSYRAYIEDAKNRCQEKKERVDLERKKFMEFKKQVALNALNSRSGKPIPPKDIEQYMVNEVKKEHDVVNVRLENIKLKNKLKKKEQQLKSKEELAEGLHLIDFEQLKIENQTYNEKIEERNEASHNHSYQGNRDILSRTKQARDALRIDNQKLRQNCGLLGSEPLLRDFEERKDESDELLAKLETLKMRHAELTLHCNQVRRKIDQARLQAP